VDRAVPAGELPVGHDDRAGAQPGLERQAAVFPAHHRQAIENTAALQANLLSGDIDMAPGDAPALTLDQVLQLRRQQPDRFTYIFSRH